MVLTLVVLLLAATAGLWLQLAARPQPVKARRNLLQEEMLAAYMSQRGPTHRW